MGFCSRGLLTPLPAYLHGLLPSHPPVGQASPLPRASRGYQLLLAQSHR